MMSKQIRIALVEDDLHLQQMYRTKFELENFNAVYASNGIDGLAVIESFQPDVVLLDLRMPIMSGDEMLLQIRQTDWGAGIRVIILTNISKDEAPQSLRFLNVDRYIVKAHSTPVHVVEAIYDVLNVKL